MSDNDLTLFQINDNVCFKIFLSKTNSKLRKTQRIGGNVCDECGFDTIFKDELGWHMKESHINVMVIFWRLLAFHGTVCSVDA